MSMAETGRDRVRHCAVGRSGTACMQSVNADRVCICQAEHVYVRATSAHVDLINRAGRRLVGSCLQYTYGVMFTWRNEKN
jgi:hypothetical protein